MLSPPAVVFAAAWLGADVRGEKACVPALYLAEAGGIAVLAVGAGGVVRGDSGGAVSAVGAGRSEVPRISA